MDSALDAISNGILHICLANQNKKTHGGGNRPPPSACVSQNSVRIGRVNDDTSNYSIGKKQTVGRMALRFTTAIDRNIHRMHMNSFCWNFVLNIYAAFMHTLRNRLQRNTKLYGRDSDNLFTTTTVGWIFSQCQLLSLVILSSSNTICKCTRNNCSFSEDLPISIWS